jgi:hypothetical protein
MIISHWEETEVNRPRFLAMTKQICADLKMVQITVLLSRTGFGWLIKQIIGTIYNRQWLLKKCRGIFWDVQSETQNRIQVAG